MVLNAISKIGKFYCHLSLAKSLFQQILFLEIAVLQETPLQPETPRQPAFPGHHGTHLPGVTHPQGRQGQRSTQADHL